MSDNEDIKTWFSRNIDENLDALYGVALRLTGNPANAEDLVAECAAKAWMAIDSLEDRSRFRSWIFRILRNTYISDCRKRSVRPSESPYVEYSVSDDSGQITSWLIEQPDDFLVWWANPEREYANNLLGEQIKTAMESIPEVFRTTILLVNVEGLTYDEAAEALGVPRGTVRSRMKRGRALLQKALWEHARAAGLVTAGEAKGAKHG